jgi:cysteine desulfurase/selenocysteine lyase
MVNIQQHTEAMTNYAREQLQQVPGIRFIGTGHPTSGIVSFLLNGTHPHDLATVLNEKQIAVRAGHHCTQPLMHRLGIPGTVRASFGVYNTFSEIDRLVQGLQYAQSILT